MPTLEGVTEFCCNAPMDETRIKGRAVMRLTCTRCGHRDWRVAGKIVGPRLANELDRLYPHAGTNR